MAEFIKTLSKEYLTTKLLHINQEYCQNNIIKDQFNCHIWQKAKNSGGYGVIKLSEKGRSRTVLLHLLIYYLRKGQIPSEEENVSHLCHKTLCINIDHLTVEPHRVNCQRSTCNEKKECLGHDPYPSCIFP